MERSILLVADHFIPVPPETYGGVERIVDLLAEGLANRGWKVTLAGHPDSTCPVSLLPLVRHKSWRWTRVINASTIARHHLRERPTITHSFGHCDLIAPLWPFNQLKIQSFQAFQDDRILLKRTRLLPRRNLWFTVCGHHMVDKLSGIGPTRAIHNGVKLETFQYAEKVSDEAPFVFLGRIEPIKGTHHAIRIAKDAGRRLVIAGNISENATSRDYFKEVIQPELSDQISYIGPVNDAQKNALLGGAAALLMPIEWDEPFGIVMAEALACGTPVIGTARGALPEIVDDGVTGACCQSLEEMITAAKTVGIYSRSACRRKAESAFSSEAIVDQYEAMYTDIYKGGIGG